MHWTLHPSLDVSMRRSVVMRGDACDVYLMRDYKAIYGFYGANFLLYEGERHVARCVGIDTDDGTDRGLLAKNEHTCHDKKKQRMACTKSHEITHISSLRSADLSARAPQVLVWFL
jgi:hypothetical protein